MLFVLLFTKYNNILLFIYYFSIDILEFLSCFCILCRNAVKKQPKPIPTNNNTNNNNNDDNNDDLKKKSEKRTLPIECACGAHYCSFECESRDSTKHALVCLSAAAIRNDEQLQQQQQRQSSRSLMQRFSLVRRKESLRSIAGDVTQPQSIRLLAALWLCDIDTASAFDHYVVAFYLVNFYYNYYCRHRNNNDDSTAIGLQFARRSRALYSAKRLSSSSSNKDMVAKLDLLIAKSLCYTDAVEAESLLNDLLTRTSLSQAMRADVSNEYAYFLVCRNNDRCIVQFNNAKRYK